MEAGLQKPLLKSARSSWLPATTVKTPRLISESGLLFVLFTIDPGAMALSVDVSEVGLDFETTP